MRNKMASRVAYRYMKKVGFLGKLLNLFKEPKVEQQKRPKFESASLWFHGNPMYGKTAGELQHRMGLGKNNTAIVDYEGIKIKISVHTEKYQQDEMKNSMTDIFAVVSATGVDENISKRDLLKFLVAQAKKARLSDKRRDITKEPKGRKY